MSVQCEYCGEVPISGDCPHGCHERKVVAWRGYDRYLYCLTHSPRQVTGWEYVYKGDPILWGGRECSWCGKVLVN
jgi:hypothetical protein